MQVPSCFWLWCRVVTTACPWLVVSALCFPTAGLADERPDTTESTSANSVPDARSVRDTASTDTSSIRRPLGPDEIPESLPGRWKVSLCIKAPGHAWIRYENLDTGEVRSISRYHLLVGGWADKKHLRWHYPPTTKSGLYMDREQGLERRRDGQYLLLSTIIDDPVIYRGDGTHGHGMLVNNCVTYTRDAWHDYTGEWYDLPPAHAPADLRHAVLTRHPEAFRSEPADAKKKQKWWNW